MTYELRGLEHACVLWTCEVSNGGSSQQHATAYRHGIYGSRRYFLQLLQNCLMLVNTILVERVLDPGSALTAS